MDIPSILAELPYARYSCKPSSQVTGDLWLYDTSELGHADLIAAARLPHRHHLREVYFYPNPHFASHSFEGLKHPLWRAAAPPYMQMEIIHVERLVPKREFSH